MFCIIELSLYYSRLNKRQPIIITGVEGGGVTLYGQRTEHGWRFSCNFVDQTPFMLAENEDQREIRRKMGSTVDGDNYLGRSTTTILAGDLNAG